jgi:hypothetical protein
MCNMPSGPARAAMLRFNMYAFIQGLLACTLPYLPCISAYAPVYPSICLASESVEGRKEREGGREGGREGAMATCTAGSGAQGGCTATG